MEGRNVEANFWPSITYAHQWDRGSGNSEAAAAQPPEAGRKSWTILNRKVTKIGLPGKEKSPQTEHNCDQGMKNPVGAEKGPWRKSAQNIKLGTCHVKRSMQNLPVSPCSVRQNFLFALSLNRGQSQGDHPGLHEGVKRRYWGGAGTCRFQKGTAFQHFHACRDVRCTRCSFFLMVWKFVLQDLLFFFQAKADGPIMMMWGNAFVLPARYLGISLKRENETCLNWL